MTLWERQIICWCVKCCLAMSFLDQTTGTFLKDSIPHMAFAPSPPPKKIIPAQPLGTLAFRQWRQELLEVIQAMEIVIGLSLYQITFGRFKNMQPEYQLYFFRLSWTFVVSEVSSSSVSCDLLRTKAAWKLLLEGVARRPCVLPLQSHLWRPKGLVGNEPTVVGWWSYRTAAFLIEFCGWGMNHFEMIRTFRQSAFIGIDRYFLEFWRLWIFVGLFVLGVWVFGHFLWQKRRGLNERGLEWCTISSFSTSRSWILKTDNTLSHHSSPSSCPAFFSCKTCKKTCLKHLQDGAINSQLRAQGGGNLETNITNHYSSWRLNISMKAFPFPFFFERVVVWVCEQINL